MHGETMKTGVYLKGLRQYIPLEVLKPVTHKATS
jgi:hypothetical protein